MDHRINIPPLYLLFHTQVHECVPLHGVRVGVAEDVPPEWQTVIKLALTELKPCGRATTIMEEPKVLSFYYPRRVPKPVFADLVLRALNGAVGNKVRAHNAQFFCARPASAPDFGGMVPKMSVKTVELLQDQQGYAEEQGYPNFDDINGSVFQRNGVLLFTRKFSTNFGAESWAAKARARAAFRSMMVRRGGQGTEVEGAFHPAVAEDPKLVDRAVREVSSPRAYLPGDRVLVIPYSGDALRGTVRIKSQGLTVLGQQTKTAWVVVETGAGETLVADTKRVLLLD